jgi:peptide/nickel transport system substrate-binding protein
MRLIVWVASGIVLAGMLLWAGPAVAQTTYVFGNQGEPVQLDSAVITDGISNRTTRQIYEGLVKYNGATTEVVPALAEKWQVSQDGTVWTFTLRQGVKFHDGNPFDAAAVVWNFDRWRLGKHPQHENQIKAGQTFNYYVNQFGGFDDKSLITKVEALNPQTVRVTL